MATALNPLAATAAEQAEQPKSGGAIVSKDDFLRLLVAQIKNQNPLNPADGVEFLAQLAQFSQLEQLINIGDQLDAFLAGAKTQSGGETESGTTA